MSSAELKEKGWAATDSYGDGYQVALIAGELADALDREESQSARLTNELAVTTVEIADLRKLLLLAIQANGGSVTIADRAMIQVDPIRSEVHTERDIERRTTRMWIGSAAEANGASE